MQGNDTITYRTRRSAGMRNVALPALSLLTLTSAFRRVVGRAVDVAVFTNIAVGILPTYLLSCLAF